jgi:hypothetical protein
MKSTLSSLVRRLKDSTFLIVVTVVLLAAGTATAAKLITGKDIKNHSITGKDIKKGSLPLSVLQGKPPTGQQGPKGETGIVGAKGSTGPAGASAITEVFSMGGPIAASIPSGSTLKFVGEPAEVTVFSGDQGLIEGTVTVGTGVAPIDDKSKFALTICVGEGSEIEALDEETKELRLSPTIAKDERVTTTVSSGFFVSGPAGESFTALLGPCVLNETGTALDDNDRAMGYVMVSAIG